MASKVNADDKYEFQDGIQLNMDLDVPVADAHYYNINDVQAWQLAGLLVLLNRQHQPVRAELHMYSDLPSHIHEGAVRQARQLLQTHYSTEAVVPMRVLMNTPMRDAVEVRLAVNEETTEATSGMSRRLFAAVGAVIAVALVVAALFALRGNQALFSAELPSVGELVSSGGLAVTEIRALSTTGQAMNVSREGGSDVTVELPPSINARNDLRIGTRVAIVPGLRLTLRSEPGGDAGVPVGYMMDDDTAVIVDGPEMTEGTSDTIVWWLVNLDDGTEAWAAANTSDKTLLIPAP